MEETYGIDYAQHARVNSKPRLEAIGETLDAISIEMYLHASFTDPEADIQEIMGYVSDKKVLPFILGNGNVIGTFVIPTFKKQTLFTDPKGNIIEANLTIELLEFYSEDRLADAQRQAVRDSFATSARSSNVRTVEAAKLSPAGAITENIGDIQLEAMTVNEHVLAAESNPNTLDYYSGEINESLDSITDSIQEVQNKLSDAQELQDLATTLPTALQSIYTNTQNMKAALPISDIEGFKVLNRNLQGSVLTAKTANIKISNESVIRRK